MRKTLFVTMNGSCGMYATKISTTKKCGNEDLITLQTSLNELFKSYKKLDATEANLSSLWSEIQKVFRLVNFKPSSSLELDTYNEIVSAIQQLGDKIAYFTKRANTFTSSYYLSLLYSTPMGDTALLADRWRKYMFTVINQRSYELDKVDMDINCLELSLDDDEWCAQQAISMIKNHKEEMAIMKANRDAKEQAEIANLIISPSMIAK